METESTTTPSEPSRLVRGEPAQVCKATLKDIPAIRRLFERNYRHELPPYIEGLALAQRVFPQGQLVAQRGTEIVGYASSLKLRSDEYPVDAEWNSLTAWGTLANHVPDGDMLYAAEILIDASVRGQGVGSLLYRERDALAEQSRVKVIRATARLADYARHSVLFTPQEYVKRVAEGELRDSTLSFQIGQGFTPVAILEDFKDDPDTLGWAAVIVKPAEMAQKARIWPLNEKVPPCYTVATERPCAPF